MTGINRQNIENIEIIASRFKGSSKKKGITRIYNKSFWKTVQPVLSDKIIIIRGTIYLTENDELVKTYKRQHNI